MERPAASIDLKIAAFKALLKGPLVFVQFCGRFEVSHEDMREWLDEAIASLDLAVELESVKAGTERNKCSSPLVCEERKILLGDSGF